MLAPLNVSFEFGSGTRPKKCSKQNVLRSECLIQVFASNDIDADAELLATYGNKYWKEAEPKSAMMQDY